jgi:hypothetical protein
MTKERKFKSLIRDRLINYSYDTVVPVLYDVIKRTETIGFSKSAQESGLNLVHLLSLYRWAQIYCSTNNKSKRKLSENGFRSLYNSVNEIGWRDSIFKDIPPESVVQRVAREAMRNQKFLQIDCVPIFIVIAAIFLYHIQEQSADDLFKRMGLISRNDFLAIHFSISITMYLEKSYGREQGAFKYLKNQSLLDRYIAAFIPDEMEFREHLRRTHTENLKNSEIWKEVDDVGYLFWEPMFLNKGSISVISNKCLGYFLSYGILSKISKFDQAFYSKEFSDGYESFMYKLLSNNGKIFIKEQELGKIIPGTKKRPDAFLENATNGVFIEFKACQSTRIPFERLNLSDNRKSLKNSIYKGLIQLLEALTAFKINFPEKHCVGLLVTIYDFFPGMKSVLVSELLNENEQELYANVLDNFAICTLQDFLPASKLNQTEFIDAIHAGVTSNNFFQFTGKEWKYQEIDDLNMALNDITKFSVSLFGDSE